MNLAKTDISLSVDGRSVTAFSYGHATDRLKCTPRRNLALGTHTVEVTAKDAWGNGTTRQWSFKIVR